MASPNNICQLLIIIALIALSVAISLLLRYLHRSSSDQTSGESLHRIAPQDESNPLPLFTFSSLTGTLAIAGDCAVCLSNFNPEDKLRLLPLCCHAFHAECIDTWISAGQTCPLCRSPIYATESDLMSKIRSLSVAPPSSRSFRVEIGSVSRRLPASDSGNLNLRRSFSIGDFEYVIDDALPEIAVPSAQLAAAVGEKREGEGLAAEVAGGGERGRSGWLMDYVERMARTASFSVSSSFRSSGRFCFVGSSRRTDVARVHELDLEASQLGDEIAEAFSWLSPV